MPLQDVFFLNQLHLAFGFSQKIKICCEILSQSVVSNVLMNLGVSNSTPFLHISGLITSFNQKLLELQNDCKKGIFMYQGWFNTGDWLLISHTINWIKSIWTGKYPCTATVQRFFIFLQIKIEKSSLMEGISWRDQQPLQSLFILIMWNREPCLLAETSLPSTWWTEKLSCQAATALNLPGYLWNSMPVIPEVLKFEILLVFFKINLRTERIFLTRSACTGSVWKVSTPFSSSASYFK